MEVRIAFRAEIYIDGKNLNDIARKWEAFQLFSEEAYCHHACENEVISVMDAGNYKDLTNEFNNA